MHFVLKIPSLQQIAAAKIIAALWNHPDILKLIAELSGSCVQFLHKFKVVRDKVDTHASALELTEPCKRLVFSVFSKPVGTNFLIEPMIAEIFMWCHYHYHYFETENSEVRFLKCTPPKRFCWTMHGVLNYAKTAEIMVKDQSLTDERRYEMACINCFEEEARELFPFVAEDRRREYMNRAIQSSDIKNHDYNIVFFTYILLGDVDQLNTCFQQVLSPGVSINQYLFFRSLYSGNRTACDYFFNKLDQAEKEGVLGSWASVAFSLFVKTTPFNLLLYYLSLMSEEQQERLFRESMGDVLVCFLQWPMQSLFLEVAEYGKRYMVYVDYEKVLRDIARNISAGSINYDYSQLFSECWSLIPTDVQRLLLDNVGFLDKLVDTDQQEIVVFLLKEAPSHQLLALIKRNGKLRRMLKNESVMSELMEFKENAALVSSMDKENEEKRLRSECLSQLVDMAMEKKKKRRRW